MQCFQKDPNLRVSAKKLLKHPWIMSGKKAETIVSARPMQYDQAVESVKQWNEALKSPDHDSIRRSRPTSLSPLPSKKELTSNRHIAPVLPKPLNISNTKPSTDSFRSPELENDNWDADFASAISPSALQLPHLKPQDNFAGLFSAENLKAYATFETVVEEGKANGKWSEVDPLETVKPFTPQKGRSEPKVHASNTSSVRHRSQSRSQVPHQKIGSKGYQSSSSKAKISSKARPSKDFTEDAIEDYSDLVDSTADNDAFQKKLQALKIQDSKSSVTKVLQSSGVKDGQKSVQSRKSTSLRRFPSGTEKPPPLPRTRSSVEIQKYAEDDDEDLESFLEKDLVLPFHGSDSGSDRGTLMMSNSKLSNNSLDEEDEYDDPFAQFEEEFDQMDLEANVARDRYARQCTFVEGLVSELQLKKHYDDLADITEQLVRGLNVGCFSFWLTLPDGGFARNP